MKSKTGRLPAALIACSLAAAASPAFANPPTPVVLFPAFHLTKLKVMVENQTVAPECPARSHFEDWFQNDHFSPRRSD